MHAGPLSQIDAVRLERGDLHVFETCPFALPNEQDLAFMRSMELGGKTNHNIYFDPGAGQLSGVGTMTEAAQERLEEILSRFSREAAFWLRRTFPLYSNGLIADQVSLRMHEEATRSLRYSGRNDVLHIDSFPNRPTAGRRVLRIYANFNEEEPRVWATGPKFAAILRHYGKHFRVPSRTREEWRQAPQPWQRLLQADWSGRPAYDTFMQRLEEFLKADDEFQEKAAKRYWHFPPGSAWILFADGLSHAVLRGQFALEHSFLIEESALLAPEAAPLAELVRLGQARQPRRAG